MARRWKLVRRWWRRVTTRPETIEGRSARQWLRMLRDPARAAGARAILKQFSASAGMGRLLREALADPDPACRAHVCAVLAAFASGSDEALEALIAALADPNAEVRKAALIALHDCRWDAPAALAAVSERLTDPDLAVRSLAADLLALRRPGLDSAAE